MLTLHYAPGTISIAAAITLEEAGLPYAATQVDFANKAQTKAPYLALNPKGRVPLLETPGGLLTETGAILDYIAAQTEVPLVPADPYRAGQMREVMYYLASTMHVAHAHKMRGHRWADREASWEDMKAKVPQTMTDCCAYLENHCAFAPFAVGDSLTLADPYLMMVTKWAPGDGVDLAAFPRLAGHQAMMLDRASVRAVTAKGML